MGELPGHARSAYLGTIDIGTGCTSDLPRVTLSTCCSDTPILRVDTCGCIHWIQFQQQLNHEQAIKRLGHYLFHTRKAGIVFSPDKSKGLECYIDAAFAGRWKQVDSKDADNVMSQTVFVIMYMNCPVFW